MRCPLNVKLSDNIEINPLCYVNGTVIFRIGSHIKLHIL